MPITPTAKIWMNGKLVDWDDARVHVLSHGLNYGSGVFEGMRAYDTADGPAVFRLTDHMRRLQRSAQILAMDLPYDLDALVTATKEVVRANGVESCYIRPLAFFGYGEIGASTLGAPVDVIIACWIQGPSLGAHAAIEGIRTKVSSWARPDHNITPPQAKMTGNYMSSALAKVDALRSGYEEAIMLNRLGLVAEGSGQNIFCARDGRLITPPSSAGALEGITRHTVLTLCEELEFDVAVDNLTRSDLYVADEVFLCGTAAEISAVKAVDDRPLPAPGPMTEALIREFQRVVGGQVAAHKDWVEYIDA